MESSLKNGHAKQGCHSMIQPMSSLVEKCGLLVAQPVQDGYMLQLPYIPYRGACRAISYPPMLCVLISHFTGSRCWRRSPLHLWPAQRGLLKA